MQEDADAALDAFQRGDSASARAIAQRIAEAAGASDADRVEACCVLSRVALRDDDLEAADRWAGLAEEAAGDSGLLQSPLHLRAAIARLRGHLPEARGRYRRSIAFNEAAGLPGPVAVEQRNLAYVELRLGDPDAAERLFDTAHRSIATLEPVARRAAELLDDAVLAMERGDPDAASDLLDRSRAVLHDAGRVPDPDDAVEIGRLEARLRSR